MIRFKSREKPKEDLETKKKEEPKISPERIEEATKLSEEAEKLAKQGYEEKDERKIQQAREMLAKAFEMLESKKYGEWQELTDEDWEGIIHQTEIDVKFPAGFESGLKKAGFLQILAPERFNKEIKRNPELKKEIDVAWEGYAPSIVPLYNFYLLKALDSKKFELKMKPEIKKREKEVLDKIIDFSHIPWERIQDLISLRLIDPKRFKEKWSPKEKIIFEIAAKIFLKRKPTFKDLSELKLLDSERFKKSIPKQTIETAVLEGKGEINSDRLNKNWIAFFNHALALAILQNDIEIDPKEGLIIHYPPKPANT